MAVGAHVRPHAPPLMRELYDELAEAFPREWGNGSPYAKHSEQFRNNFEQTFTEVVLGNDYLPSPALTLLEHQVPLALYFSRFVLDSAGEDCYSKLLVSLNGAGKIPHTVFGSLNYECLLEQAAQNLGIEVDYWCGNPNPNMIRVAKLHGSRNFITAEITQGSRAMLAGTNVQLEIGLTPLPPRGRGKTLSAKMSAKQLSHYPVMSQVSHYKQNFASPAEIQKLRNPWNAAVLDGDTKFIVIIGVSFNCNDVHINEPIEQAPSTVLYIGDEESFKMWHEINKPAEHISKSFEDGFQSLLNRLGIGD